MWSYRFCHLWSQYCVYRPDLIAYQSGSRAKVTCLPYPVGKATNFSSLEKEDFTSFYHFGFNKLLFYHLLKLYHSCFSQNNVCMLLNWSIWCNNLLTLLEVSGLWTRPDLFVLGAYTASDNGSAWKYGLATQDQTKFPFAP